ncbi:MAG TPA: 16S rRNA (cytidine(1402)-2'-O)-methyltransferase [Fimbriimonadaceae bacterium]|nr:16S rRNA (cytidine(1402)-2'-O)-methyltransferase [Fimbriimonadaceae bacterium]
MGNGRLTMVATPIGNLADLSPRAIETLGAADFWIVEDTRVSGKLQAHLGIRKPMRVLNDHTSEHQVGNYVEEIAAGASAALLTDGGSPVVSDPGAILCDRCHDAGVEIGAVPGPSAVTTALMLSGFFGQRFCFLGFLGKKPGAIKSELRPFKDSPLTLVLFESPFRIEALLKAASEELGERRYAICREMTKIHEQVFRAAFPTVPTDRELPRKGEVTVVIEGRRRGSGAVEAGVVE